VELKTDAIEVFGEFSQALFAGRLGDSATTSLGSLNNDDSNVLFCRGEYAFGSGPRNTVDSNVLFFRGVVARIPAGIKSNKNGKKFKINGFLFFDEYERKFLAKMITRAFLAHDLCYGRS
jgi:hypothetical protein